MKTITHEDIKIRMIRRKVTIRQMADEAGVSHQYVSAVVCGQEKTAYIREIVAKHLGWEPKEIWPDYDPNYGFGPRKPREAVHG